MIDTQRVKFSEYTWTATKPRMYLGERQFIGEIPTVIETLPADIVPMTTEQLCILAHACIAELQKRKLAEASNP
jgi:hypothetical protein